jgi:hypothetical protein
LSTQQLFEGPDLSALLQRVQKEVGAQAKILRVDKVRSGGIGGFFQRERFEVEAEAEVSAAYEELVSGPAERTTASEAAAGNGDGLGGVPVAIEELADLVSEREQRTQAQPSTSSAAFHTVMQRVVRDLGGDVDPEATTTVDVAAAKAAEVRAAEVRAAEVRAAAVREAELSAADRQSLSVHDGPTAASAPVFGQLFSASHCECRDATGQRRGRVTQMASEFARLGLPPMFEPPPGTPRSDLRRVLLTRLAALPDAPLPPQAGGEIVAVIGDAASALAVAARVAGELGSEDGNVALASREQGFCVPSWLQLADVQTAATRRRMWRRRPAPVVVAVDAPMIPNLDGWAREVLDALEPSMVLGLVDARSKPEDVEAWARVLGGIDAIALGNVRATMSPGAVLQLSIPVLWLDGEAATPERWSKLLLEQLAAFAA